jgi:hypothetical protein
MEGVDPVRGEESWPEVGDDKWGRAAGSEREDLTGGVQCQ